MPKQEPFLFQPGQHRPAALLHGVALQVRRTLHRVIEAGRVREVQPDMGQLLLTEIEQRAAHHRKQGRVVPGVIQQHEQLHRLNGFLPRKRALPRVGIHGDLMGGQHRFHLIGHALADGQQNSDIPIVEHAALAAGHGLAHPVQNIPGDPLGLGLGGFFGFAHLTQMQLGHGVFLRRHAGIEHGTAVVVDLRHPAIHHVQEGAIHRVQHALPAAEISVEDDLPLFGSFLCGKSLQLVQKQPRLRLTEPVNALLHITDVEIQLRKLFVLLRRTLEPVEDALLNGAHVLIFIHEYRVEPGGFQLFQLRVAEHAQREMLQIVKVQRGRVGLFLLIGQVKDFHGPVQTPQGRNHGVHIVHRRFQPNGQKCLQGLDAVLVALAQGLVPFDKAHLVPGDGLDPGNGDETALLQARHHGGKALPHSFRQGVQRVQIGFDGSVQPFGEAAFLRQAAAFVPDPHHAFQHQ